jgi:vacuolar-type H+-ATPase subunit I/STV1
MAFILKFKDKDAGIDKEIRFFDRHSANLNAEKLKQYGHTDVLVEDSFKGNYVGVIIKIIGFLVIIAGIISGIIQGIQIGNMLTGQFNFSVALYWWTCSIVAGILIVGVAEIIHLLDAIHKKI